MREMMASLGKQGGLLSKIPGMGRLAGARDADDMDPASLMAPGRRRLRRRAERGATAGQEARAEQGQAQAGPEGAPEEPPSR